MPLPVGQTIKDRYQITRIISTQGGFGNTYLAYDILHGQAIVIKESKTAADIEQDALLSELRLLLSLDHPRLAKVYDGFFHERQLCVTMQYIPGRDVSTYLVMTGPERRADPPDRPTALRWIIQTLEALAYLHSHGIIHRDVKPSNLRVHTETGGIFLLDFGISHHTDRTLIRAHSPRFSPPEQHDPAGIVTPASDIYAVGATLYMLLTGREPPYRDDHYDKTLRLPTEENQTIPVELENIVLKALCFDPADRYQDAQTMLQELRRLGYAPPVAAEGSPPAEPASVLGGTGARLLTTMTTLTDEHFAEAKVAQEAPPTQPTALPLNEIILGRYHIRSVISERGGFGTTYRAFAIERKQEVVIKVSKTTEDTKQNALLAEREVLSKLKHRRLPAVYDAFFYNSLLCVEMQYIPGRDVTSYLRNEPLDRRTALRWTRQLLEALAYLHKRAIIHCDVKPANLRVNADTGDLFLLDFGISQRHNQLVVRGFSRYYSAPEQRLRNSSITPASDVYAAGAILYAFLTGTPPPEPTGQTEPQLFADGEHQSLPEDLKRIVRKALKADPTERYPQAQAMLADLQRLPYARPALPPMLLWSLLGLGVTLLVVLGLTFTTLIAGRANPSAVAVGTAPAPTGSDAAAPLTAAPTAAPATARAGPTTMLNAGAVLLAPTSRTSAAPTPTRGIATSTPAAYVVRQIEVVGQTDSASIYVGKLPVQLTLLGDGLETVQSVILQPRVPGQRNISLKVLRTQGGRLDLELTSLPQSFRPGGVYDLRLDGQSNRTIVLRDYIRQAHLQGIKLEYRYLAAIRPFPSLSLRNQTIPGPFAVLYPQPDPARKGAYLRNGDLVEILDETTNADFYRVRVSENFDSSLVGTVGWVWAWIVEDRPPAPPVAGAIQMPYNLRGEAQAQVTEWLQQRGVLSASILSDSQNRERIPEVFDRFQAGQVVSSDPAEGAWIMPNSNVVLGVRAP